MPSNSYPFIAKEGWPILFLLAGLYLYWHFYVDISTAQYILVVFFCCLFLFRDPPRVIPSLPLAVVSPVHGKVVSIDSLNSPWLDRTAKRIRIKMSFWDIFSLRSPIEGKIMDQWSKPKKDELLSREYAYWIKTDENDDVVTALHLNKNKWFYRIYLQSGHRIGQGQRCGYLFFGSQVDVFVTEETKITVEPGEKLQSGSSVIAHIVHNDQATVIDNTNTSRKKS